VEVRRSAKAERQAAGNWLVPANSLATAHRVPALVVPPPVVGGFSQGMNLGD